MIEMEGMIILSFFWETFENARLRPMFSFLDGNTENVFHFANTFAARFNKNPIWKIVYGQIAIQNYILIQNRQISEINQVLSWNLWWP